MVLTEGKRKILFLCTGNSCRSQMAEAMLRDMAGDRFEALSAGSNPAGFVHQLAIDALRTMNVPLGDARSKSWDEFAETPIDVVITVCDHAAAVTCPVWQGAPIAAHWPMSDPATHAGTHQERIGMALVVARRLRDKIRGLVALDWSADSKHLKQQLNHLGAI